LVLDDSLNVLYGRLCNGEIEMTLIDFVKEAGKSLGLGKNETPDAQTIREEVESHGLDTKSIEIEVNGDEVAARGEAMTRELREKIIVAIGNIMGIARAANSTFHKVKKGDTLWAIASEHYGNGAKFKDVFQANRPMLSNADAIYPGQVLRIPPLAA